MSKIRRVSLFLFIVLFILIAPSLVLYANGWRIDTSTKKLVQTGAIYLNMNVREADIFINNDLKKTTSPISSNALLNNIIPGIQKIRIEKNGFTPWGKEIRVEPQQTARFMNILLLPKDIKKQELLTTNTERSIIDFSSSPDGNFIAIQYDDNTVKIWDENEKTFLMSSIPNIPFFWTPDNSMAFVRRNKNELLIINLTKNTEQQFNLAASMTEIEIIYENDIFIISSSLSTKDNRLSLISEKLQNETLKYIKTQTLAEQIIAFTTHQNNIYFLDEMRILWSIKADGSDLKQISQTPLEIDKGTDVELTISKSGDNFAVKETTNGTVWVFDRSSKVFEYIKDGIHTFNFSPDDKKLLLTSTNEIYVYFLKETFYPHRKNKTLELITRLSGEINDVWWHPQNEHIIFIYDNAAQIIELESGGTRNSGTLVNNHIKSAPAKNGQIIITLDDKNIYASTVPRIQSLLAF